MIFRIVLGIFLLSYIHSSAQNYTLVDATIRNYPKKFNSTTALANRIKADFTTDTEKVRAIYQWLSINIQYNKEDDIFDIGDYRIIYSSERDRLRQIDKKKKKQVKRVLATNKAICLGYAQVFKAVCDHLEIQSEIIPCYSKTTFHQINSNATYKNHAWNAVKINNEWKLLDITWSTVSQIKDYTHYRNYYFFVNPKELILTHFPVNNSWQLLDETISRADFFKTPIFYANYFIDKFKIAEGQNGTIKINDSMVYIYFDEIPKSKEVFYTLGGKEYKALVYKKTKLGSYVSTFKYKKKNTKSLTIYSGVLPVLSFVINPNIN